MSNSMDSQRIVYFHYERSPYGRRVRSYLAFRHIAYTECIQPPIMPRPDLKALGVNYRRTPSMAIGRDVYVDTRMIISRLEELFPPSEQHPAFSTKETAGLAALLNKLTVDASIFSHAVTIIPHDSPALQSEAFLKDRADFYAPGWTLEDAVKARPDGIMHLRHCFDILESLLADDRKWIGDTDHVTLADLEGVWSIDFIISSLSPPEEFFSPEIYPKVYAWRDRFQAALETAKTVAPKPSSLEGPDAVSAIIGADFSDKDLMVDHRDPTQLREGMTVQVYPTDGGGFTHKDAGRLIKLTKDEVAIAVRSETNDIEVHVHAPRWGFKIEEVAESRL